MMNLNIIISKNLTELRKLNKLTQQELAEKLNYSDKAVSKWEQGDTVPTVEVLYKISKLYGVSLDYIVTEHQNETLHKGNCEIDRVNKNHKIITILSVVAVLFVASILYVVLSLFANLKLWTLFCWAVPASIISSLVFSVIWHNKKYMFLLISALLWSTLVCICLQFITYNLWLLLSVGILLQIAVILWSKLVK